MSTMYFIGGAPRSGKTTTIQRLNERLPMLTASSDAIRNVSKGMLKPEDNPRLFKPHVDYGSKDFQDKLKDHKDKILALETAQSEEVWKSVLDFIGYYQRDGKPSAIEGVDLLPKDVAQAMFEYKVVYLISHGQDENILRYARENGHDWLHKYDDQGIRAFCKFNDYWNDYFKFEAQKYDLPFIEVDPDNFDESIDKAVNVLLS